MIEVKLSFASLDELRAFLAIREAVPAAVVTEVETSKPAKRSKKETAEPSAVVGGIVAQTAAMPSLTEPTVTAAITPPASAAPKAELKDVIAALTLLGQKRGREQIVATLANFGLKDINGLKPEQYAECVANAQKALA